MIPKMIHIILKSATTFGSGDGVTGLVDREIEHDSHGFPYLRGKTLKGLLAESAENILFAMQVREQDGTNPWFQAKTKLFGLPGRGDKEERGSLHVGDAQLPANLRSRILSSGLSKNDILYSLTGIRRQTAINPNGAPDNASLRSMRVLLPGVILEAPIDFDGEEPDDTQLQLLAAAVLDLRHGGTGRNRGRGWLEVRLEDDQVTRDLFQQFAGGVK
jgi:CRISPR/Cas system CSM-associated protein Csm3 (group 7 of RAMP superfamily)